MTKHFPSFSFVDSGIRVNINGDVIEKRVQKAQKWLDNRVMTDMLPYMPMNTGMFIANTQSISRSLAGTGLVCAGAPPMGRYLYYGKVMVDSQTGKGAIPIAEKATASFGMYSTTYKTGNIIFRFRRGATLVPTNRNLKYSRASATAEWFETAKQNHYDQWINGVEKILNGKY